LFGLSPLSAGHPLRFQPKWVRPSTGSYPCFSLPPDSSPGFASAACDYNAILKARLHCGSFHNLTSPHTATRWLILQKARRHTPEGMLRLLVGARFQVLFHSPLGVLFTFPSRYSSAIGHRRVFSLGGWSPLIRAGFHVPGATRERDRRAASLRVRGSNPLRPAFPGRSPATRLCGRRGARARPLIPSHDPSCSNPARVCACMGLGWSAFARRY
jgi:hypothetical protein